MRKIRFKTIFRLPFFIFLQFIILFLSSGRIDIPQIWIYVLIISIYYPIVVLIMYKFNPELITQRARGIRKDTKSWDKVLMPTLIIMPYIQLAIIGLDVGRFQWSSLSVHFAILGIILFIIAAIFMNWAVLINPHFEPTVRIQSDRDHKVITNGPYKIVRHPGYVGGILWTISIPLILGSFYGLILSGINILFVMIRTWLEDKTLHSELEGYSEYANRVKYRLFPWIW